MEEDDMLLVIVGEEDEPKKVENDDNEENVVVKEEIFDDETIEEVFVKVKKYGQRMDLNALLDLKDEPDYCEDNTENLMEYSDYETNQEDENDYDFVKKRTRFIKKLICDSYIQQIIKKSPELENDEDELVKRVLQFMKNVKTPKMPSSACRTDGTNFICCLCETASNTLSAARKHFCEKHGPRYLMCLACGVDFRSLTNLYKHEKKCRAPHTSAILKARAKLIGNKARHRPFIIKTYGIKKLPCPECPSVFVSRPALDAHVRLHRGLRPHICDHCGAAYAAVSALRRHKSKHLGYRFECDHCGKRFNFKDSLAAHMTTHLPQKPFPCGCCGRRYSQRAALRTHIRRAHLALPHEHPCVVCGRRFPKLCMVKTHMNKEHGLSIMTRKMFLLKLPKLPPNQIEIAKVFFNQNKDKGQKWIIEKFVKEGENNEKNKGIDGFYVKDDAIGSVEGEDDDVGVQGEGKDQVKNDDKVIVIIENGNLKLISADDENRQLYNDIMRRAELNN